MMLTTAVPVMKVVAFTHAVPFARPAAFTNAFSFVHAVVKLTTMTLTKAGCIHKCQVSIHAVPVVGLMMPMKTASTKAVPLVARMQFAHVS